MNLIDFLDSTALHAIVIGGHYNHLGLGRQEKFTMGLMIMR
ncbi:hypothetical protein [Spirosoma endophyticum]|uniref:Uncharacterized protein n=1 Tax=Spirosoma endophyticum TaxID=662367 RepID=A0A1I1YLX4_9BACT|nr:hypothetical protein [Spirosoma endophyticum]SFE20585.1 hypothetical protein SAMN05216167_111107 [Spirosoma endophyticum]